MTKLEDAGALLRANLIMDSPLRQGKIIDGHSSTSVTARATVFTRTQRESRVADLLRRGGVVPDPSLPEPVAHRALLRLTGFMVSQFERLQLYDLVWDTITVRLAHVYLFAEATRTLYIPHNFDLAEFAAYVDDVVPHLAHDAASDALRRTKHLSPSSRLAP